MDETIKVLILEDSEDDAELMSIELHRSKIKFIAKRVDDRNSFLAALINDEPDIIISDYNLPNFDGKKALELTRKLNPLIPFIMVTGSINEEIAVESIRSGAQDYLIKEHLGRLGLAVISAIESKNVTEKLSNSYKQLQQSFKMFVEAMSRVVEIRDPYTAGHQQRVAELAVAIGEKMQLESYRLEGLLMAGMIHDIGKICVPSEILSKPGRLNDAEMMLIRMHSEVGAKILEPIEFPWPVAAIVAQHHEKIDGSGYGLGLKGDEILLEAKILSVADVVEAISSHRPYRPALGLEKAIAEIEYHKGILYDIEVVDACKIVLESGFKFTK